MEEKPVGLFDMDGTLFAYTETLERDMRLLQAPEEPHYNLNDLFDESKPWLKARMDLIKSIPGWWRNLPKLEIGWQVYRLAVEIGYEIEILTKGPHRKRRAWMEKAECIDLHFGEDVTVNIVGKGKGRYYGRFLCDDYTPYMEEWLKWRKRGLGILIGNEQNVGYRHPNVIRYDGLNFTELEKAMRAAFVRESGTHWRDVL